MDPPFIRSVKKRKRSNSEKSTNELAPVPASPENHNKGRGLDIAGQEMVTITRAIVHNDSSPEDPDPAEQLERGLAPSPNTSSLSKTVQGSRSPTPLSSKYEYGWDINDCTQDTRCLVFLLHVMGGNQIPGILLKRALEPQRRWTEYGTKSHITAFQAGLDKNLLDVLSDTDRQMQASEAFVKTETTDGSWTLSLNCHFQRLLMCDQEKEKWAIEALKLICFVFPRDQLFESQPSFVSVAKLLSDPLIHTARAVTQGSIATRIKVDALETLLVASKVGCLHSRERTLSLATHFLEDTSPTYLHAEMAHQQSNLSRLAANFDQSERFIYDLCCRYGHYSEKCIPRFYGQFQTEQVSKRLNALYGRLHGSHLENLVQREQYRAAIEEVDDWKTSENPSLMECCVLPGRAITIAKIYRSQGMFTDAESRLTECISTLLPNDTRRCQVICSLADVYCDLRLPDKGFELLSPEIETERRKGLRTKPFRRLLVSLIDNNVQRGRYDDALVMLAELRGTFSGLSSLDISDQLLHVRTLVASARICYYKSQFHESLGLWEVALTYVHKYKSFKGEGFTYAMIHLSISLMHLESGNNGKAYEAFACARRIYSTVIRDYWIPTLAIWGQYTAARIQSLIGWDLHMYN